MKITNWKITKHSGTTEVSADVDGYRLWYGVPHGFSVSTSGDPFLAAALFPAMRQGEKIEVDPHLPVSPKFLKNVLSLQEVFHSWNPAGLKKVPVIATIAPAQPGNPGMMSFFSGGVDSMYTFLKHLDELTHAVNIHGFDFYYNKGGGETFSVTDIKDLGLLSYRLMVPLDQVSAHLRSLLSTKSVQLLSNYRRSGVAPGEVEAALVEHFQQLIDGESLYELRRFEGVKLRSQTKELIDRDPRGKVLRELNRLLLEDAYPREISGKQAGHYETAVERNSRFVESFGKSLVTIETNFYCFGYGLSSIWHGAQPQSAESLMA